MTWKITMLILFLALVSAACARANQPPVAYLDSISPSSSQVGDTVVLTGHGEDQDGEVISYEWRSSIDGILGNSSSINITSLSEGEHTIYFKVCDDKGACSQEATANLTVSAEEVTAESAAETVVEEVIEPMSFEGPVIGFKLKDTLKPGDTIAPYGGEKRQVDEESHFFFVDLYPGAYYAHDVLFVTVSKDGNMNVSEEEWWPMINDELPDFLGSEDDYWNGSNWIHSQEVSRPVTPQVSPPQLEPQPQQQWWEAAVVVNGHHEDETLGWDMAMSAWRMWELFNTFLDSDDLYDITPPPIGSNTPSDFLTLLDEVCSEGYDHITVYMMGHGNIDLIMLGNIAMYAEDLVDFLNDHPDTTFSFLMDSCHIGSFIDDLKELPNVYLVLTATSTYFQAYGDWDPEIDPNPDVDSGGEWTSSMYFSALEQLSYDGWTNICAEANRLSAPPSVVLFLAAFSNEGTSDGLALDACYLGNIQFPQAWSPWGRFCNLWEQPPRAGDALLDPTLEQSGSVTSGGGITRQYAFWWIGDNDSKRSFYSFPFPDDMPAGSTVLVADMHIRIKPTEACELGYLGDLIIEHLTYGELDAGDFSATAEEVDRIPIRYVAEDCSIGCRRSVKTILQQDFDSPSDYSQYRLRFTGEAELIIFRPAITIYYELR